jgi:FkbM family methyltransferase
MRWEILARSVVRHSGAKQLGSALGGAGRKQRYEERVQDAFVVAVNKGDCVWDVGANVGFYTASFSDLVGPDGSVIALEPVPASYRELTRNVAGHENVKTFNVGLSDRRQTLSMTIEEDPTSATNSFFGAGAGGRIDLELFAGDELASAEALTPPDIIKIDVEGFEPEVLAGLRHTLSNPRCRMVLCEVHFGILAARGEARAPDRIQRYLSALGFAIEWIDASHVAAYR